MDNNTIYDWIKSNYMDKVRGLHPIWHDFRFEKKGPLAKIGSIPNIKKRKGSHHPIWDRIPEDYRHTATPYEWTSPQILGSHLKERGLPDETIAATIEDVRKANNKHKYPRNYGASNWNVMVPLMEKLRGPLSLLTTNHPTYWDN